jgi:glucokinase
MPVAERPVLAVDLGGTKLAVAVVSPQGDLVAELQELTCQDGPEPGIEQIVRLAQALLASPNIAGLDIEAVGVDIPAVLKRDSDFVVWAPNLNGWRDVALRPALEAALGLPVYVEYDGHTAVLAECWLGAGRGFHSVEDLIIGTGIGGGMTLEGHLIRGIDRLAGAAGWFLLDSDPNLRDDRAHSIGFWEAMVAGPGLARQAKTELVHHPDSVLAPLRDGLTAADIFHAADQGDRFAIQLLDRLAGWLGAVWNKYSGMKMKSRSSTKQSDFQPARQTTLTRYLTHQNPIIRFLSLLAFGTLLFLLAWYGWQLSSCWLPVHMAGLFL